MEHILVSPARTELRALMEHRDRFCLSLFLPTDKVGREVQQNALNLKNHIREAEYHLLLNNISTTEIDAFIKPVGELLENEAFWQHPDEGLAIFRSPELLRTYWLPLHFKEQVIVTRHFYLKPLLPLLTGDGSFYLLALSHNHIRLLQGTRYGVSEVALPEAVPHNLSEAMKYDESENELQYHSSSSGASIGKGGRRATVFHGQGVGIDDEKDQLLRYFQQIDRGLHALLKDERAPLLLAGVTYLFPIYREANTYPHLLEEGIPGNPDRVSLEELQKRSWATVAPFFLRARQEEAARYQAYAGTGQTSDNVREIVPAAYDGRIESLFIEAGKELWGTFNPTARSLHVHRDARFNDDDLLDIAATQTLLHGGSVYISERVQMPGEEPLAAVYRY